MTLVLTVLYFAFLLETWKPRNSSDLTLRIYGYDFQPEGEDRFQPITGVQFSDLNLNEYSFIPEGCGIVWEYSTDGGVIWDAHRAGGRGAAAQPRGAGACEGGPEMRLPAIDRLKGFHPRGPSLYRRVLVPVCMDREKG
jgi:hypothetical protein